MATDNDQTHPKGRAKANGVVEILGSLDEVTNCLILHGCADVSHDLDLCYSPQTPFARGGFGAIYQGSLNGRSVALKCIEIISQLGASDHSHKNLKRIARELYAWTRVTHPGVLEVLGFARFRGQIALVTPWMSRGSLGLAHIQSLELGDRIQLCIRIAQALEHLHLCGIVHGDVKPENIIMSTDNRPQLADFGCARLTGDFSLGFTGTACVFTIRFAAPELLDESSEHTTKTDVYALAMTILTIMSGKKPFPNKKESGVMLEILVKKNRPPRLDFPTFVGGDQLWELLERCWTHMPEDRPTAAEVTQTLIDVERGMRE